MKPIRFYTVLFFTSFFYLHSIAQTTVKPCIKISGEVTKPLTLYAADLAKMPHSTAVVKDHDGKGHEYRGVPVQRLLELAGVTTGKDLRGKNLSKYLLIRCADGYEVVFSLAEVDSSFTDRIVLLADAYEGKPIVGERGPFQLAVPGEKKPARSCYKVTEFVIKFAK